MNAYPIPDALSGAFMHKARYQEWQAEAAQDLASFWEKQASMLDWSARWHTVADCSFAPDDVHIRWFEGGALNVSANCVDRWAASQPDVPAIIWEPDEPNEPARIITYGQLLAEVSRCANMLLSLGVVAGDRVSIYMPMIPEAAISMLACARIGAVHSVVFGGFSPASLRGRIEDCQSRVVITADEAVRAGKRIALKSNVDTACEGLNIDAVLVFRRTGAAPENWQHGRDVWWHELAQRVSADCPAAPFGSEHPLFILYTSGSTGSPKGLQHSSAGYLLYAAHTFRHVFDYRAGDVFWCSADVGWITGHSYVVYGPLANGATTIMFEGVPTYPDASRSWQIIDKYRITQFYTAPTAIRMLMREGDAPLQSSSRQSLRVLGSVGEPINPEAWQWYYSKVGNERCAVVDTWWQTETGGHMITPLPAAVEAVPASATLPYFGIAPALMDVSGKRIEGVGEGALCMAQSWPGQARSIYGDHARFVQTYFSAYPNHYFSGDAARRDEQGYFWIEGRMDDVVNVSGHRLGTAEIEAALNAHEAIVESAVVGFPHDVKGQGIYAFVTLLPNYQLNDAMRTQLNELLRAQIGALARVDKIQDAPALPKTRSGKIMRRILRKIAAGDITSAADYALLGDISTLLNPEAIDALVAGRL